MAFSIDKLDLTNFRNYEEFGLSELSTINLIFGPNAVGKSNIIEAIQLLTQLRSFKTNNYFELINSKPAVDFAIIRADYNEDIVLSKQRIQKVQTHLSTHVTKNSRTYKLNAKKQKLSALRGKFPSVIFTPDDLILIKGAKAKLRENLDILGCQISKNYNHVRLDYQKILNQKNVLLKSHVNTTTLKSINDVMVTVAAQFICYRTELINKILPFLQKNHSNISKLADIVSIAYEPSWNNTSCSSRLNREKIKDCLKAALAENFDFEIFKKHCLLGPHLDKISFTLNKYDAKKYASQGQQRSIVLAYKMAEIELIDNMLHKKPILLLDDVMSELDEARRQKFIDNLSSTSQVFITTTNLNYFSNAFLDEVNLIEIGNDLDNS